MPKQTWISRHLAVRAIAAGAAFVAIGIVAAFGFGYILGIGTSSSTTSQGRGVAVENGAGPAPAPMPPCDGVEPQPLHIVGRLTPGYTVADLTNAGFQAVKAIEGAEENLVLVNGDDHEFEALGAIPMLQNAGWIRDRATDLSIRSCDYRLEDKPAAAAIASRATRWMVQHGVLTQEQIDAGGTTFGLQDDPTSPAHLFFTVLLAKPTGGGPGNPPASELLIPYTATVDRATGEILSAGRAHWYDFY